MNRLRATLSARAASQASRLGTGDRWSDHLRTAADPETELDSPDAGALFPLNEVEREAHFKRSVAKTLLSMLLILAALASIAILIRAIG